MSDENLNPDMVVQPETQPAQDDTALEGFVSRLMQEKGFPGVDDPEVLDQIKTDLLERVNDQINAMIIAEMPPEKLEEMDALTDGDDEEALQNFISQNVPNIDQKLLNVLEDFRNTYLR